MDANVACLLDFQNGIKNVRESPSKIAQSKVLK